MHPLHVRAVFRDVASRIAHRARRAAHSAVVRRVQPAAGMKHTILIAASLVAVVGCSKSKDHEPSKPVSCAVAAQMITKRLAEFADEAKVTGDKRVTLDKALVAAITERCTGDAWDEVPLGCLGAMATIKEGEIDVKTYNKGVDICTDGVGKEKREKLDSAVGETIRKTMKPS